MEVNPDPKDHCSQAETRTNVFVISEEYSGLRRMSEPPELKNIGRNLRRSLQLSTIEQVERVGYLTSFHISLNTLFYRLGKLIGHRPSYFIVIPILLTLLSITGFQNVYIEMDQEELFYPRSGPAPAERAIVENYFPVNTSGNFVPQYITRAIGQCRVLIKTKDNGSIFRKKLWEEILILDNAIKNFTISHKVKLYNYTQICATWNGKCMKNLVLDMYDYIDLIESKELKISYPIMIYPVVVPMFFGGIELDESGFYIESAKGINLNYFLKVDTIEDKERDVLWENQFVDIVGALELENIDVSRYAVRSYLELTRENPQVIIPYIPYIVALVFLFSIVSTWMLDCVRSKLFMGLIGILSTVMATGTAFGILMYIGVPTSGLNMIIPFIMMGIGLDDVYVLLAAWCRTTPQDDVRYRLAEAYSESGVAITFTSITNIISFLIGVSGPIKAVRLFCLYSEKERGKWYTLFCSGGVNRDDPWNENDNQDHMVALFYKNYLGKCLTSKYVKGLVIFLYLMYLSGAIYGCFQIKEGLDRKLAVKYGAYITDYFEMEDQLFRQHPYQIQVVITGDLLYHNVPTRRAIMKLHKDFESLPFITKYLTQSWMRGWFIYLKRRPQLNANLTTEEEFIDRLRETYLDGKGNLKALDVAFNENKSRIVASRFMLQTSEVKDTVEDAELVNLLRQIADESPLNVTVFNANFMHFDQYTVVRPVVIHTILAAAFSVIVISLIFIPNKWCSLIVGIVIASIEIGVLGYMSLWNVNIDSVSMIALIMTIGFSVDFSLHISYAYLTSESKDSNEKIMQSLFNLGLPITQGALSTLISITTFIFVPAYAFEAMFKIVVLVIIFAAIHGIVIVPVVLSLIVPNSKDNFETMESTSALDRFHPPECASKTPNNHENFITNIEINNYSITDIPLKVARFDPEGCSNQSIHSNDSDQNDGNNRSDSSESGNHPVSRHESTL